MVVEVGLQEVAMMLPLALLLFSCNPLTWDLVEPNVTYLLTLDRIPFGETTHPPFPVGCLSGTFGIQARDAAGNLGEISYYAEIGPCSLGCIQLGVPRQVAAPCCRPIVP